MNPKQARLLAVAIAVVGVLLAVIAVQRSGDAVAQLDTGPRPVVVPASQATQAPALVGISNQVNTGPVTLADLRGKVVLVDFWTYTCINCRRTFPELRALQKTYGPSGFTVLGVHSPEFAFEKKHANVVKAVKDLDVTWPVVEDPALSTFTAFGAQFWPQSFLLDQQGRIRYAKTGEGGAEATEAAVRALLDEGTGAPRAGTGLVDDPRRNVSLTPETYFGSRTPPEQVAGGVGVLDGQTLTRDDPPQARDVLQLKGAFVGHPDSLEPQPGASVTQVLRAREVYATATGPGELDVTVDGKPVPEGLRGKDLTVKNGRTVLDVAAQDTYTVLSGSGLDLYTLTLSSPLTQTPGARVQLYTLTYGA